MTDIYFQICKDKRGGKNMISKAYVEVIIKVTKDGQIIPLTLVWEDSEGVDTIHIEKVWDRRKAPSFIGGGVGMRYTCEMRGKVRYLFCEETKDTLRWFVEIQNKTSTSF